MKNKGRLSSTLRLGKWISFSILISLSNIVFSQEMRFDHLSVKQGLSQGNVWDVYQDKMGFMWIGTEDGLNVYDGYTFTIFRSDPADSFSISNNNIDHIIEDKSGNLWVATQNGLNFYNRKLNRFERHFNNPNDPNSLSNDDIGYVYIDRKNQLWVGTNNGLNLYDSTTHTWKHFLHDPQNPNSIADNIIETIFEDSMNQLWVGTGMGGLCLQKADGIGFTTL